MKEQLRQIYDDLSNGRISRQDALEKIKAIKQQEQGGAAAPALLVPAWRDGASSSDVPPYAEHHVILCDVAADVDGLLPAARCMALQARDGESLAERYTDYAAASFVRLQSILQDKSSGRVLVQVVVTDERLAALSGLLKTAALENPRITGQVLIVPVAMGAEDLARTLQNEKSRGGDALVRYDLGSRQVLRWEDATDAQQTPLAFEDGGVYLITGGLGALGILFAREIVARTRDARVVLTGRAPLTDDKQALVASLSATYRQLDLSDADQVRQVIASIRDEYGRLDGILHSAGMIADNFILRKSVSEFRDVFAPKVTGTIHLDAATADVPLEFFVLFSSFAGAMGNAGQADYAAANAFLDQFATARNRQVSAGERHGRTRSINWPLWQDGGMQLDAASRAALEKATGTHPMQTAAGMSAFHRALALSHDQVLVAAGDVTRIRAALAGEPMQTAPRVEEPAVVIRTENLFEKTEEYLRSELSGVLKMAAHAVDPEAALEKYGIDSILAMKLTSRLEETFGTLSRTLFFEYQTIRELTGYFVEAHPARLASLFAAADQPVVAEQVVAEEPNAIATRRPRRVRAAASAPVASAPAPEPDLIAIVGLSGRYPEAVDVEAYWQNLRAGKDCIVEVPKDRWDWKAYYSEDRTQGGHHYSKWGGFISGVDEFDPLFFNISPKEAKQMDPQERLFLQHAWMAIEDAGYTRATLQAAADGDLPGQVGVYVGVMYTEYQLFGAEASARGNRLGIAGSAASIANRVSYAFNLHGPSVTLDTMCSSSLTAIHYACQDLKLGRTDVAIAGGVNVSIHPNKYLVLSAGQFISSDGHCQSFGEGGDGYIPGEGVGVVVLKRLSDAKRDGDHIYAVIRGTALNHGGKTNGYTVPNPQAQATAIARALRESNTDARHVSYIEAHGTGTKLGDPIEIAALGKAFAAYTRDKGFCLIGSAKSNIGHCESAAGIAGLTKVLLQMQHRQIVPSLHSAQLNPHIDFDSTPFVVNQSLRAWEQPVVDGRTLPRIAGISSFGAGGSNAHVILEEYAQPVRHEAATGPVAIVLSARTAEQLRQKAQDLLAFVRRHEDLDLASLAWTLQTGREPMDERHGVVVSSIVELIEKLDAYVRGEIADSTAQQAAPGSAANLLQQWLHGSAVDWTALYGAQRPRRISLPTYPFAKDRYWIEIPAPAPLAQSATAAVLHPLLHSNTSDLQQQSYSTTLRADEISAAVYLEMAHAAVQKASGRDGVLELRNVVWTKPAVAAGMTTIEIALFAGEAGEIEFEIYSGDVVLCQGHATWSDEPVRARIDGESVRLNAIDTVSPDYVLHPAVAAAALEVCARAIGGVPSAIESLRIIAPCARQMVAWVRNAGADVDLCDEHGNVCAQFRGVSGQRVAETATQPVASRREIAVAAAPVEKKKSGAIALAAPSALSVQETATARPRIALAKTPAATVTAASSVRLFDEGDGVFSIHAGASSAEVRQALDRARQESSLDVLLLYGLESLTEHDRQLARAIVSFPYPIIAVLRAGAKDAAFVAAALCDFMVCGEEALYGFDLAPSSATASLLAERFGETRAHDLLYVSRTMSGRELRAKGWTCPIVPAAQVETHAKGLATALAAKSQDALRLLEAHLTRGIAGLVDDVTLSARRASASGDVRVVTLGSEPLDEVRGCKAVVLIIEDRELSIAAALDVQRAVRNAAVPVLAAFPGNASGNTWLAGLFCDATVYSTRGVYSSANAATSAAAAVFAHRFGNEAAREILLTAADYSGADLQRRAGAVLVADDVVAAATNIAESWPAGARAAYVLDVESSDADETSNEITAPAAVSLRSRVVTVTAHPGGIAVVRMEDRDAKNMFSDALQEGVAEAFAHIAATPAYKVVVLTGYDTYFASGGTKESLLAIQAGKIKFTDSTMFRLPLDCALPVIAAMQGHGIGAGWSLGMFADLAIMSEESRYVSPYMEYGFTPGAGATWSLADKLGQDLARESLLTAQPVTGRMLAERGLRLPVLPRHEVLPAAMALAERIARAPRARLLALKQRLTAYAHEPLEETLRREVAMHEQTFVGRADTLAQIESSFHREAEAAPVVASPATQASDGDVLDGVMATLRTLLANELQMRESDVDQNMQFIDMGLDSIGGVTWIRKINEKYQTAIDATKIYSHPTLIELSRHVKAEAEKAGTLSAAPAPVATPVLAPAPQAKTSSADVVLTPRRRKASRFVKNAIAPAATPEPRRPEAIAIIGMAGQFPQAKNVEEFWRNLAEGRNCISQVARERWDLDVYYQAGDAVPGKTNCQWLGALEEYDRFDPLFFNISPTEALTMDPQQRLFLQACWHSIEDAGYDARALSGSKCGVFAGCATGDYHQLSRSHQLTAHGFTGNATSVLAARISYFLNLQGPCVSIDTACSSSLVAIAQACDSLTAGVSDLALAGGVYVMSGPDMHIKTAQAAMLSPEGRCFTFDQRADGFVPGEGVGVVVLKRLADAQRDGDVIYGVVEGWGVNQDGKTNGITAPNPESQTRLQQEVYDRYAIDPANIQLIEAHGTGTKLGDPIEVEGLKASFAKYTQNREFCALGSVKSNIGHTLTAAGVAGVIKLLLALKHKQLPPTIHFEKLNEHIDLSNSPFYVNTRLQEWKLNGAARRQAAISSFGFSGTNAHLVIGESPVAVAPVRSQAAKTIVPLSARTPEQLRQKVEDLLAFVRTHEVEIADVAFTLQTGRVPMDERVACVASSTAQLAEQLQGWLDGAKPDDVYEGQVRRNRDTLALFSDPDLQQTIEKWLVQQKLPRLADLWVKGLELDWKKLYGDAKPRRIALPVYPFAKERYWIDAAPVAPTMTASATNAVLHPLLHRNASDLSGQRYCSTFHAAQTLTPVALLEMARAAIEHAVPERPQDAALELYDIVWAQPVVISGSTEVTIALSDAGDGAVEFEIFTDDIVHCQGSAAFHSEGAVAAIDATQSRVRVAAAPEYVLHPNLLDGLFDAARTPVALESLRIFGPAAAETFAGVRNADDKVTIDVCDADGIVCAQFRGLSLGIASDRETVGRLLARPVWQASEGDTHRVEYAQTDVMQYADQDVRMDVAALYRDLALTSFARIQDILATKAKGKVLVQIVVSDERLAGLAGLLKTAALENPQFAGQLIVVPPQMSSDALERLLETEQQRAADAVVRYENGIRQVLRWEEVVEPQDEPPVAFRDDAVYLITGGFGGLGVLFIEEILGRTRTAKIIVAGRSPLDAEKQARLDRWSGRVAYRQADVADRDQVEQLVSRIREEHGSLDGILHCAGVLVENAIASKSGDEFERVLAPKVEATVNLDEATQHVDLDFFVLFSSLAAVTGNRRTADYAVANAFLDHFAVYRNRLVAAGQRHGRTRSINWPVWQDGGMGTDAASQERLEQATGMRPMRTATGLHAFHFSLALPHDQLLVVEGVPSAIRASYLQKPRVTAPVKARAASTARVTIEQIQQRLKQILASVLGIDASDIDLDQAFMELGLDSFLGAELVIGVNKEFATQLSHLQVFDYPTIRELASFVQQHVAAAPEPSVQESELPAVTVPVPASSPRQSLKKKIRGRRPIAHNAPSDQRIAIVGMSGRYPGAENLRQYWDNLSHGRNSIGEIPPSRWDAHRYYDPDPAQHGKASSKWMGAVDGVDCFDPLFFRISPQEADYIDPHHRLFLQESYRAFEDAGYAAGTLANRKCGVYLGINSNEYALLLARHNALGASPVTSNHTAIAAARIAYYLNLKGPAISVDTACSSSLVAIHLACQGLLSGETDMALAGGVTVWLSPESFVSMTQAGMLSADGQCKAFDDSADGIVVGDGVGAIVLKRLVDAEADGDFIYGVILGSGVNQDGKTNGITAPSISSQIELERSVYARHGIHPDTITYVETHGTGTSLGDPIELEALSTVFKEKTERRNYCGLGSVKSNIGHTTSAAGVASVQKVLLSLQHRTLPPTLHVKKETSRFDFSSSPFYLVRERRSWDVAGDAPRRAAVSSFGFSGTNAHLVIEEYRALAEPAVRPSGTVIVPLSARTAEQLRQKSLDLLDVIRDARDLDLAAVAHTLQTGRDAMEERLAFVVRSVAELEEKLAAFVDGAKTIDGAYRGRVETGDDGMTLIGRDDDMQEAIDKWIARGKHARLAELWVRGLSFDWTRLQDGPKPRRISLPGYPFARERHWIDLLPAAQSYPARVVSTVDTDSIDDIIDRIGDDLIDPDEAVTALKMLV